MKIQKTHIVFSALAFAIIGLITLFTVTSKADFGETSPRSFDQLGGDFTLQSADGPVSLSDFNGKTIVMYFGFMSCPEVCPNSMGVIQTALNKLNDNEIKTVQGLMISIDPERDTLQSLKKFTQYYHANIQGLTGTTEELQATTKLYGAYFKKQKDLSSDTKDNYVFEHVSRYYVINSQGQLVDAMRHSTTPNELVARLKETINRETLTLNSQQLNSQTSTLN
jgi:protein SCO1/2